MGNVTISLAVFSAAFFALTSSAIQAQGELPFESAYASEQKEITFDSLGGEIRQFELMSQWHKLLGDIKIKRLRRDYLKKHYERGRQLFATDAISRDELERREYEYKLSDGELGEQESRAQMVRISVESTKYGIMMQGDPQVDYRKQIAEKMKESLGHQLKGLKFALSNAVLTEAYLAKRASDAKDLYNRKVITEVELEIIVREHARAVIDVGVHTNQIGVIGKAVEGLDRSLERLF